MVKDAATNVWVSLPLNFGARLTELAEWTEHVGLSSFGLSPATNGTLVGGSPTSSLLVGAAATVGAMGLGWYVWSLSRSQQNKIIPLVDPEQQTRELPDGSRVCAYLQSSVLMSRCHEDVRTVYDAVRRGARVSGNGPMLGARPQQQPAEGRGPGDYQWLAYNDVIERSLALGRAMRSLGLPSGQDCFVGIYSKNRPEWVLTEQATYAFNNVIVPLYDTLGAESSVYIINQASIALVVCDTAQKALALVEKAADCPALRYVVVMDTEGSEAGKESFKELATKAEAVGVRALSFAEFERLGVEDAAVSGLPPQPPTPQDLATICYTSGTTGVPKGVMLTHGNIIADVTTLDYFKNITLHHTDVMFSFLPLAHMFERVVQTAVYSEGGSVGFFRGDIRGLVDDIQALRPTILPVVPRVLNRVYDKVLGEVNKSSLKKLVFDTAMAVKQRELAQWIIRNDGFFDRLAFRKVRETLGGRVKLMITGSAPLSAQVLTFVRCALGCIVCEGYGQTECVAAATITIEGDPIPGHVGVPSPCNTIKLVDVPELNYFARDGAGEICIKGTNVFKGYYKQPEQTAEVLDSDGWLHTGDIGRWTEQGTLRIVDRKKHIFKLAQGEYVAPEKIENVYTRSALVAQCFVHGDSLKTSLVGIIVPDPDIFPGAVAAALGGRPEASIGTMALRELCEMPEVKRLVLEDLHAVGKKAGLFSFEQVKDVHLCSEPFTVENDLLTPTLKSKRPQLKRHFAGEIAAMYVNLS